MKKSKFKIFICFLIMMLTMATSILLGTNLTISAETKYTDVVLGELHGGLVSGDLENGYIAQRIPGNNNMAVFEARTTAMEFEADMEILSGNAAAGLMFGVADLSASGGNWSALHIQPGANAVRVFCEKNWSLPDGFHSGVIGLPAGTSNSKMHLKISIDTKDVIKVYVNNTTTPVYTSTLVDYNGGYVGLMTYDTQAKFTNITLKGIEIPSITNLELIGAELEETYSPKVYSYTSFVDASVNSIKIKAEVSNGKFVVNNRKYESGATTTAVMLRKDINTIFIGVLIEGDEINLIELTVIKGYDKETAYDEVYRPQFHYSQQRFWANDPNGLVYNAYTQEYHMFYQYNPRAFSNDGWHHWGHAISKDLVHWTEHPIAIYPDDIGTIASGSAVIDRNNTSGLFDDSIPAESRMVMIFTYFANASEPAIGGRERQAITYSLDNGYTWIKYEGNPVIPNINNEYDLDFRDPKVMWMEETNEWLMIIAGGRARIFTSPDLIHWTYNSNLKYIDGSEIISECPDLFPLAVDDDKNNIKWVYTGSGLFYVVGDLVKENGKYVFKAETQKRDMFVLASYGWAMYATQSFNNIPDGRRILVSWMPQYDAAGLSAYGKNWNGIQSIPIEAKLITKNGQPTLSVEPISELETLRTAPIYSVTNKTVNPGDENILKNVKGKLLDIEASFTVGSATEFGFNLRVRGTTDSVKVRYSVERERLTVDTTNSSVATNGVTRRTVSLDGNKLTLRILVDTAIIDVFANEDINCINKMYYTNSDADGMEFYTVGGSVTVDSMKIYGMNSSWVKENMVNTAPLLLGLEVVGIKLNTTFDSYTYEYSATTAEKTTQITPNYLKTNMVVARINGKAVKVGETATVELSKGVNRIVISVADQMGKRTYILNVECTAQFDETTNKGCKGGISVSTIAILGAGLAVILIKGKKDKNKVL